MAASACCAPPPGTEIDHINGDSSDPDNLRLLCHTCHVGVTLSYSRTHLPRRPSTRERVTGGKVGVLRGLPLVGGGLTGLVDAPGVGV